MSNRTPFKNCASGLALVAVILLSIGWFSGLAAAADNFAAVRPQPAGVPEDYVITPFGYFHPSCVQKLADGATLLADGRVAMADGSVEPSAPACSYPHFTSTGVPLNADMRDASGSVAPVISGWLEYISTTTNTWYGEISATWTVPQPPTTVEGQTLFYFPGFEDTNNILSIVQPVVQFGQSAAGGGNYWTMASWNCCMSGIAWYSRLVKTNPGDSILGTIISDCKRGVQCAKWKIATRDVTTGKKSVLARSPAAGQVWNWAFGAVAEVYGVKQCSDFPADNSLLFTVQLYDPNRQLISDPGWVPTPAGSGISPQCNYGLNVTPTQETLEW